MVRDEELQSLIATSLDDSQMPAFGPTEIARIANRRARRRKLILAGLGTVGAVGLVVPGVVAAVAYLAEDPGVSTASEPSASTRPPMRMRPGCLWGVSARLLSGVSGPGQDEFPILSEHMWDTRPGLWSRSRLLGRRLGRHGSCSGTSPLPSRAVITALASRRRCRPIRWCGPKTSWSAVIPWSTPSRPGNGCQSPPERPSPAAACRIRSGVFVARVRGRVEEATGTRSGEKTRYLISFQDGAMRSKPC